MSSRRLRTPAEQAAADRKDRRQFWIIAAIFMTVMISVTLLYIGVYSKVQPPAAERGAVQQTDSALPIPDGGAEPTSSTDRGGIGQLALLGGILVILVGGAVWVVHSSRRERRRYDATHQATGPLEQATLSGTTDPVGRAAAPVDRTGPPLKP